MFTLKKVYCIIFLISNIFSISNLAYGQNQITSFCSEKDTAIFYCNGVYASRTLAKRSLEESLMPLVKNALGPEEADKIEFELAYNTTNGTIFDLFEAYLQDISTDVSLFFRILANINPMPESFKEKLIELSCTIDRESLLNNQDLSYHVASYRGKILEGKKVIVVAHSQGNFFANFSYGNLLQNERKSFGIVAVATPDATVANNGPYTTLFEDTVIAAVALFKLRALLPPPLPPNITNFFTLADITGHGFDKAYLAAGSNSRNKILNDILGVRDSLTQPPRMGQEGIITVTLTWSSQPDVDLHVIEPNGTHVYYANLFGPSGYLDHDDIDGYGPEHYYVSCDSLEAGIYRVGVNYYHGYQPEIATILIQAGLKTRISSVYLPMALYWLGNENPVPVGIIEVSGNNKNGFSFEILLPNDGGS